MKSTSFAITALLICFGMGTAAYAGETVKIGFVDLQAVINLSKAGKKEQAKIKEFISKRQKEISGEEKKLEEFGKKLEKDKLTMSKEQQRKKQEEFQKKIAEFRALARKSENEVKKKESIFTKKALTELRDIVAKVAEEKGFTFIVEKNEGAVLYAQEGMDLTNDVMKLFDEKFAK